MSNWKDILINYTGFAPETLDKVITSLALFIIFIVLRVLVLKIAFRKIKLTRSRYNWRRYSGSIVTIILIITIGRIWFQGFESLMTFLGLVSAGLAFALKDPIANLAAWAFIVWRGPFHTGDRIQIGSITGDVIDIRLFQFSLMEIGNWIESDQNTGRIIHIPNSQIFTKSQANYTQGFQYIWDEIKVTVTFESDWQKARKILTKIAEEKAANFSPDAKRQLEEASQHFLIFQGKLDPVVFLSVEDSGVVFYLRYMCHSKNRRASKDTLWDLILKNFAAHSNIDFAYPTTRFYYGLKEGKQSPVRGNKNLLEKG